MNKRRLIKIVSVLMAAVMLFGTLSVSAAIPDVSDYEYDKLPVIMVSGFGATTLSKTNEAGEEVAVFPPSGDVILDALDGQIPGILLGLFNTIFMKDNAVLADSLGTVVARIIEPIAMQADGTPVDTSVHAIVGGAENTSLQAFKDNGMLDYVPYTGSEFLDMEVIGDIVGDDKVFNFTYDWRYSHVDVAELFREYVQDVLELTGAEKVNVYAISQGSLIVGAYMYEHAEDGYLNNVFFDTPALAGTDLVTDLFGGEKLALNYEVLAPLLGQILHTEMDLSGIIDILPTQFLNEACEFGRTDIILPALIGGTAFWDMAPCEELDKLIELRLDPVDNAQLIAKTNELHDGFMSHITETFIRAELNGASISIKTGTGYPLMTGSFENSDTIVNVKYSCGATCADL